MQSDDYHSVADHPGFMESYVKTANSLSLILKPGHAAALAVTGTNQFRVTLTAETFSQGNGERLCV